MASLKEKRSGRSIQSQKIERSCIKRCCQYSKGLAQPAAELIQSINRTAEIIIPEGKQK